MTTNSMQLTTLLAAHLAGPLSVLLGYDHEQDAQIEIKAAQLVGPTTIGLTLELHAAGGADWTRTEYRELHLGPALADDGMWWPGMTERVTAALGLEPGSETDTVVFPAVVEPYSEAELRVAALNLYPEDAEPGQSLDPARVDPEDADYEAAMQLTSSWLTADELDELSVEAHRQADDSRSPVTFAARDELIGRVIPDVPPAVPAMTPEQLAADYEQLAITFDVSTALLVERDHQARAARVFPEIHARGSSWWRMQRRTKQRRSA
jgi:hypothetical protein